MHTFDLPGKRGSVDALQFSPDNRLLAIESSGRIDVLDTVTGEVRRVVDEFFVSLDVPQVGFTADSRGLVYFRQRDRSLRAFDFDSGTDRVIRDASTGRRPRHDMTAAAVQHDGRVVFAAVYPQGFGVEIVAHDTATGEELFAFARHNDAVRQLAVSPDGQWVAGCSWHDLRVWSLVGGKRPRRAAWHLTSSRKESFHAPALSRGGAHLALGGNGANPVRVWDTRTREEQTLSDERKVGGGVAFAPDRPLLAYTQSSERASHVVFWDAAAKAQLNRFDWGTGWLSAVAFSPDGCRCATADGTRAVAWDVDA